MTGKKRSEESIDKQKSHKRSQESIDKQRKSVIGKYRGENNHRWIKDRTKLKKSDKKHLCNQYKEWMLSVKNRDNWECKINDNNCNGKLEAHHILRWSEFPELRYNINNGISLCHFHHPRKIKDEKKLSQFFTKLIKTKV